MKPEFQELHNKLHGMRPPVDPAFQLLDDILCELEKVTGQLDIVCSTIMGQPESDLAIEYGGLGWENDPRVKMARDEVFRLRGIAQEDFEREFTTAPVPEETGSAQGIKESTPRHIGGYYIRKCEVDNRWERWEPEETKWRELGAPNKFAGINGVYWCTAQRSATRLEKQENLAEGIGDCGCLVTTGEHFAPCPLHVHKWSATSRDAYDIPWGYSCFGCGASKGTPPTY